MEPRDTAAATVVERCSTTRGELQLQHRGGHYEIVSNGVFLMATYKGASERLLVSEAVDACENPGRVLLGGLGVGFSLAEALARPGVERVVVVEVCEAVLRWHATHLATFSNGGLDDPRVQVVHDDIVAWAARTPAVFDIVCIDVDNGPDWTVVPGNAWLYSDAGLERLSQILAPSGAIAFWSAARSLDFAARLRGRFNDVRELTVEARRGEPDCVYVARG